MMGPKKSPDLKRVVQGLVFFSMFLPLVMMSATAIGILGLRTKQTIEKEQLQMAHAMAWMVAQYLDQASRSLDAVVLVAQTAPSQIQAVMQGTWEASGYFDTLIQLDSGGTIRLLVPSDPRNHDLNISNLPYFKQDENKNLTFSRPFISMHTGKPMVYLAKSLSQGGLMVGELNLDALQNEITAKKHAMNQGAVFLLDPSGMLLAHPAFNPAGQQTNQGSLEIFQTGRSRDTTLVYESGATWVLGSAVRIERTGWVVVVQAPLFTAFRSFIWALGLILPTSIGIWLILAWRLRQKLNQHVVIPLQELNHRLSVLANADFDRSRTLASTPVTFSELTALSANCQRIADALDVRRHGLQESEKGYLSLFERLPVALFRSTPAGQFLNVNPALVRMMGFLDQKTLIKFNSKNIYLNPDDREQWRALVERDGVVHDYEVQIKRFDGTSISTWLTCRAVRDSEGQVLFYEGNFEDVTERKRLEEQIRHSQKMEAIGQLAGGVAHDFNNMLSVIMGYAELILMDLADNDPLRIKIKGIHNAGIRSMEITRQLLAFARKQTIKPKPLGLNSTLQGMLKLLKRLIGEDIDLLWIPGADLWQVKMDPSQVDQILANLCVNARDALNGPGKITIETRNIQQF